jgi:hypothetical protein
MASGNWSTILPTCAQAKMLRVESKKVGGGKGLATHCALGSNSIESFRQLLNGNDLFEETSAAVAVTS